MERTVLAVTGVPCTGKTTLSRELGERLRMKVLDLTREVEERGLCESYDEMRDTKTVDVELLRKHLSENTNGDMILDGLLSHHLDVTHVLVLRCNPLTLYQRMVERGYSREKIVENLEAEYTGVILYESLGLCENVLEVDNTSGADVEEIKEWLEHGGKPILEVDWTPQFQEALEITGSSPT
ncbi:MAG: AAA family ATPase [Candidatus Altiarchaeales archaeon]|nr:AAA family ATPase [Candidatus Altiarchaeales archaeon]MBD3417081.1 AAA family ATPase [Candidatus Altiarchaeales archaeon]